MNDQLTDDSSSAQPLLGDTLPDETVSRFLEASARYLNDVPSQIIKLVQSRNTQ